MARCEHEARIEQMLRDLATEPITAREAFKQRLVVTLRQKMYDTQREKKPSVQWPQPGRTFGAWFQAQLSQRPYPIISYVFIATVFILILAIALMAQPPQRPILTIQQGTAQVNPPQPSAPSSRKSSGEIIPIMEGDHIILEKDSSASLLLFDESKIELLPGTQLTLTTARPRSIWRPQSVYLQMKAGEVRVQVTHLRSSREQFEINMPAALVRVRGTAFRAQVISPQHAYVATDEGTVTVMLHDPAQGNPTIAVPAGYQVDAIIGQPLTIRPLQGTITPTATPQEALPTTQSSLAPILTGQSHITPTLQGDLAALQDYPATPLLTLSVSISSPIHHRDAITQSVPGREIATPPTSGTINYGTGITNTPPITSPTMPTPIGEQPPAALDPADLELTLTAMPNPTAVGGRLTYHISIANNGPGSAQDVVVHDPLPPQVYLVDTIPPAEGLGEIIWQLGTLSPHEQRTLQIIVAVRPGVRHPFTNAASVSAATPDEVPQNNHASIETTVSDNADLVVNAQLPTIAGSGEVVTYTLVYTNRGPAAAHHVVVTAQLAAGIVFGGVVKSELRPAPGQTPPGTLQIQNFDPTVWRTPWLGAGASGQIIFTATVQPGILGSLTNTVTITADSPDDRPKNNIARRSLLAVPLANVALAAYATPNPTVVGGLLTYTLTYTNHGPWPAEHVLITVTLPTSTVTPIQRCQTDCTFTPTMQSGPSLTWFAPELPVGANGTILLSTQVSRELSPSVEIIATIHSATLDDETANNTIIYSLPVLEPALSIAQTIDPPTVAPHQLHTYTLHITNTGSITLVSHSILLTEQLPAGFHIITPVITSSTSPTPTWVWRNHTPLAPGDYLTASLIVSTTGTLPPGVYHPIAHVIATAANRAITATSTVSVSLAHPSVTLEQYVTDNGNHTARSMPIVIAIQLTNSGPSPLTVVPLLVRYDSHITRFISADPAPAKTLDDGTIIWSDLLSSSPDEGESAILPGEHLAITVTLDTIAALEVHSPITSFVTIGELRDIYGNRTAGHTIQQTLNLLKYLYLPSIIRSS